MKRNKSDQGRLARRKGYAFERSVAKDLQNIGFKDAKRHLEYQYQEVFGVDIDNTGEFRIQCKNKKNYVGPSVLNEIKIDGIKVVVSKALRKKPIAIMYWEDLLKLMEAYIELQNKETE